MPNEEGVKTGNGQSERASSEDRSLHGLSPEEQLRRMSERIRTRQLESEARILELWKKRGLFGLTTSTG